MEGLRFSVFEEEATTREKTHGPAEQPSKVLQAPKDTDVKKDYRICRVSENPWQLRDPPVLADLSFAEMRLLVLTSIANGNAAGKQSPFLHATSSLKRCVWIQRERNDLYSHWLVRWRRDAVPKEMVIDFTQFAVRQKWLQEQDDDSALVRKYCDLAYNYTAKDSELLYLARPDLGDIEWWDEEGNQWVPALNSAKSQDWMHKLATDKCNVNIFSTDAVRLQAASSLSEASYWGKA